MDEVLQGVIDVLTDQIIPGDWGLKGDFTIMDDYQAQTLLSEGKLPCIYVTPIGERDELGPFGNTKSRFFDIRVRIVEYSSSPTLLRDYSNTKNIYKLSDAVRAALAAQKNVELAPEMGPYYLDWSQSASESGAQGKTNSQWLARDLRVTYWRLEDWSSEINNQAGLETPPPFPY